MVFGSMHLNTFCNNEESRKIKRKSQCEAETEGNLTVENFFPLKSFKPFLYICKLLGCANHKIIVAALENNRMNKRYRGDAE